MGVIIKFIVKSIKEKKFRTFLIIFAVALSGALYFASTSLSESLVEIFADNMRKNVGNADIMISPKEESPAQVVSEAPVLRFKDKTQYIIKAINGAGRYKIGAKNYERISLTGMTLDDYMTMNSLQLTKKLEGSSFNSNCMIISQKTAEKYHLDVGDQMELYIRDIRRSVKIYGIALPMGMFLDERQEPKALISYKSLSDYMQTDDKPKTVYIKAAESVDVGELILQLQKSYPKYVVEEAISQEELNANTSSLSMPLLLMTFIVTFMSVFIIYSSFKVITLEKLPIIGTFRSIGASRKTMNRVLVIESLFYGMIGGIAACILGIVILYIMTQNSTPDNIKEYIGVKINISFIKLFITFILSVVVCLVSSMIPILEVSKKPLKEIVLGSPGIKKKNKIRKDILGILFIITAFVLPAAMPRALSLASGGGSIVLIMIGTINVLPTIIKLTSKPSEQILSKLFGNVGTLAVKNIKGNKSILNSISLITIGIVTLLMINNVSMNLNTALIHIFKESGKCDLQVSMNEMDKSSVRSLLRNDNIEGVYPVAAVFETEVKELGEDIACIESIQDRSLKQYMNYDYMGKEDEIFNKIDDGRYIVTAVTIKNRFNLKEGDKLTLKFPNGERVYTVLGFINTSVYMGNYALISDTYLQSDSGTKYYNNAYINVKGDPNKVLESLESKYVDRYFEGQTLEEMLRAEEESSGQLMSMLIGFSLLALLIGSIGIINNLIISFMERKKSIAVLRSVGMNKKQIVKMVFIEALYSGIIGGAAGIAGGIIVMQIVPYILEAMRISIRTYVVTDILWIYLAGGVAITIIASVSPALKSSKLNIIEAIKYE